MTWFYPNLWRDIWFIFDVWWSYKTKKERKKKRRRKRKKKRSAVTWFHPDLLWRDFWFIFDVWGSYKTRKEKKKEKKKKCCDLISSWFAVTWIPDLFSMSDGVTKQEKKKKKKKKKKKRSAVTWFDPDLLWFDFWYTMNLQKKKIAIKRCCRERLDLITFVSVSLLVQVTVLQSVMCVSHFMSPFLSLSLSLSLCIS